MHEITLFLYIFPSNTNIVNKFNIKYILFHLSSMPSHFLPLFLLLFLFPTAEPTAKTCRSCCKPPQSFHALPAEIYIPLGVVLFILYLCWKVWIQDAAKQYRKNQVERSHVFNGILPSQGSYDYKTVTHNSNQSLWTPKSAAILTFNENKLSIEDQGNPESRREGTIGRNGVVDIPTQGAFPGFRLYATELPDSNQTGFAGFESSNNENLWVFLPVEFNKDAEVLFPFLKNGFMILFFGLILLFTLLCMLTFGLMKSNGFYGDFFVAVVGTPWGAFASFIGLGVMLYATNPFGWSFTESNTQRTIYAFGFFSILMMLCASFAVIDMITADFMKSESMIDTRGAYTLDRDEIANYCKMDQYDCSVYWSANLTKRNDDCANSYYYLCISFDANMGSCSKGNDSVFNLFLVQSLFQCALAILWACVSLLLHDLRMNDRWPSVASQLGLWNKDGGGKKRIDISGSGDTPMIQQN